jgi:hypothetical protein
MEFYLVRKQEKNTQDRGKTEKGKKCNIDRNLTGIATLPHYTILTTQIRPKIHLQYIRSTQHIINV